MANWTDLFDHKNNETHRKIFSIADDHNRLSVTIIKYWRQFSDWNIETIISNILTDHDDAHNVPGLESPITDIIYNKLSKLNIH